MSFRYALESYIKNPDAHKDSIIYKDDKFVVIRDSFPKSIIHYLLLPRDTNITKQHPLTVFKDEELKKEVGKLILKVKEMIQERLKDEFGIEEDDDFIQVGVHSVPSMANLHIHLMTRDFNSEKMKRKQHYNSFTTEFFVKFDELSLSSGDKRLDAHAIEQVVKTSDMKCVYCGKNFKNKFVELKKHLTIEFENKYKRKKRKIVIEID